MAIIDIKVPSPGESITEVTIARWLKSDGEYVNKDEEVLEIDSDKATLTVSAEQSGALKQAVKEGELVKVGSAVGKIDTTVKAPAGKAEVKVEAKSVKQEEKVVKSDVKIMQPVAETIATPLAKKIMEENKVSSKQVSGSGSNGKITKADVLKAMTKTFGGENGFSGTRDQEKQKMTPLRKKLAQRLVAVKNQTAMLTTFNEVDMSKILELRAKYNP